MARHPFLDALIPLAGDAAADAISQAVETHTAMVALSVSDITARDHARTKAIVLLTATGYAFYKYDPDNTDDEDGVTVIFDSEDRPFVKVGSVSFVSALHVTRGGAAQSIPAATPTKVQFNTIVTDTLDAWDETTNFRYLPQPGGTFQLVGSIELTGLASGVTVTVELRKNGSAVASQEVAIGGAGAPVLQVADLVELDGIGDYVELFVSHDDAGARDLTGAAATCWLKAVRTGEGQKGDTGDPGAPGAEGANGAPGVSGASALTRVRVVATANAAIATGLEAGDAIDGVTLAENDLVLLAGQTAPAENGVYVVPASGAASRHADFSTYDAHPGTYFSVMEGTAKADTLWRCTSDRGGTLGSTAITIAEASFGGGGASVEVERDLRLQAMRTSALEGTVSMLVDGFADAFKDETGVDGASSTNESYNAGGDYYEPTGSGTAQIPQGTGTPIGDMTGGGGLAAAFDSNTAQDHTTGAVNTTLAASRYIGKDYSAAPKKIAQAELFPSTSTGYVSSDSATIDLQLYAKNGSAPANDADGTLLGSTGALADATTGSRTITSSDPDTLWDYVWVRYVGASNAGYFCSELRLFEPSVGSDAMDLRSVALVLESAPATANLSLRIFDVSGSAVAGTDFKFWLSRDNGANWGEASLTHVLTRTDGSKVYDIQGFDLTGLASGTSLKWRFTTHNSKNVRAMGAVLQGRS